MDRTIPELKFDDDFLLDSAQARIEEGDLMGALTVLNKREELHEPLADAYELYADIYEELEQWNLVADAWFRFLDTCAREEFSDGYEGLAIAFMNMGNELQSAYYYRLACGEADGPTRIRMEERPKLHLVHSEGAPIEHTELLAEGLVLLKVGELAEARKKFAEIPEESADYASGAGLSAMCALMDGNETEAEEECERLLKDYPDNVQILTTYCAVLGAREKNAEARSVAEHLASLEVDGTDDLYRVATALCETGLDEDAYRKLAILRDRLPYDNNVLWFFAVAAHKTGRSEEAIDALEMLTTLMPRKAVAKWYLSRLRAARDDGSEVPMTYYYRMPAAQYRKVASFLLNAGEIDERDREAFIRSPEFIESFQLAFDEMEGRDTKLQLLAAKVAIRGHADSLLRSALIDSEGDEVVKLTVLHDLICRNEDNSFGTVLLNLYREVFVHELHIGPRKSDIFMQAFADVYSKYALLGEECEEKLCTAAEDIYASLAEADAWDFFDRRAEISAAIYREAHLREGERTIGDICKLFEADVFVTERILEYLM